jgi:DNA invertase Pin-like site-specific DNA recombinase
MSTNGVRAAIYLRVSRDDQTTQNQRLVLARVAGYRGWSILQTYEDQGISGAKGRDKRPAFDLMLRDAVRRRFDVLMVWSIDRLGRSVLHVANASPNSMRPASPSIAINRRSTAQPRRAEP